MPFLPAAAAHLATGGALVALLRPDPHLLGLGWNSGPTTGRRSLST